MRFWFWSMRWFWHTAPLFWWQSAVLNGYDTSSTPFPFRQSWWRPKVWMFHAQCPGLSHSLRTHHFFWSIGMKLDPRWHTSKVEEAILIRLQPTKINRDSRMKIPGAWMPTTKKHNNRRAVRRRTAKGTTHWHRGSKRVNHSCGKTNQSQQSIQLYNKTRDQSTLSPDED